MVERVLFGPGGSTEAKQDSIIAALAGTLNVSDSAALAELQAIASGRSIAELYDALLRGRDYFGATVVGSRYNMVEVHFDDTNWASFGTLSTTGGGQGGTATQANGRVQFLTGTATNGSVIFETTDFVRYSGGIEIYGAGTHAFITPPNGANDRYFFWPLGERAAGVIRNGVGIGYKGTAFGVSYVRGSVEQFFVPRASWDDPCDGTAGSDYTKNGLPYPLDPTKGMIMQVRAGLFGYSGFQVQVLSPDRVWVTIWHWGGQDDAEPVFTNYDLRQVLELVKGAGGTFTSWGGNSACWAAGRMSPNDRITDPINDRTLVSTQRSAIFGKAPNGNYVQVTVNNQGRLQVTNDAVGATGTAIPTSASLTGGSDGGVLRPIRVLSDGKVVTSSVLSDENGVPYSAAHPVPTVIEGLTIESLTVSFPDSVVSTLNSRSTPLGANEEWYGGAEEVLGYAAITAILRTDAQSAVNGAWIEFSPDGITWLVGGRTTIPANQTMTFRIGPEARYFRFHYLNGPVAQTSLVCQVLLHINTPPQPHLPLGFTGTDLTLAASNLAHLKARKSTGAWESVALSAANALMVDASGSVIDTSDVTAPNELRLDYDTRSDKQPVYLGKALYSEAVEADPVWTVTRFTYESAANDARLTSSDVRTGIAWTDRTTGW